MKDNVSQKLNRYLKPEALSLVKTAADIAVREQMSLFLVGGIVRDLLLERESLDIDFVVLGDALVLADRLASVLGIKVMSRSRFGTAKLKLSGLTIDLVTARRESYSRPGALPTVFPGDIKDDLFRRDFTVNAMAVQLTPEYGSLVDPYNGIDDLRRGFIRILHDRSFIDDSTRIFRAIRYEQRLGFNIEKNTGDRLCRDIDMIDTVGPDRIKHELLLFLNEALPEKALLRAHQLGVLARIHPRLRGDAWVSGHFHKAREIYQGRPNLLYLCLLVYRFKNSDYRELLHSYNFTRTELTAMSQTLALKSEIPSKFRKELSPLEIYQHLKQFNTEAVYANLIVAGSGVKKAIELYLSTLRYVKPCLTGNDLVSMGITAGPKVGKYLEKILEARLAGSMQTKKEEELFIRKLAH